MRKPSARESVRGRARPRRTPARSRRQKNAIASPSPAPDRAAEAAPERALRAVLAGAEQRPAHPPLVVLGARKGERQQAHEALVARGARRPRRAPAASTGCPRGCGPGGRGSGAPRGPDRGGATSRSTSRAMRSRPGPSSHACSASETRHPQGSSSAKRSTSGSPYGLRPRRGARHELRVGWQGKGSRVRFAVPGEQRLPSHGLAHRHLRGFRPEYNRARRTGARRGRATILPCRGRSASRAAGSRGSPPPSISPGGGSRSRCSTATAAAAGASPAAGRCSRTAAANSTRSTSCAVWAWRPTSPRSPRPARSSSTASAALTRSRAQRRTPTSSAAADDGSLDAWLRSLALAAGVALREGVAGAGRRRGGRDRGPRQADGVAREVVFASDLADTVAVLFDPAVTPTGYAYLFCLGGHATFGVAQVRRVAGLPRGASVAWRRFREALGEFAVRDEREHGQFMNFSLPATCAPPTGAGTSARRPGCRTSSSASATGWRCAAAGLAAAGIAGRWDAGAFRRAIVAADADDGRGCASLYERLGRRSFAAFCRRASRTAISAACCCALQRPGAASRTPLARAGDGGVARAPRLPARAACARWCRRREREQ